MKFGDAEAIGLPFRVTFGRGLAKGLVELTERAGGASEDLPLQDLPRTLAARINAALEATGNPKRRFG